MENNPAPYIWSIRTAIVRENGQTVAKDADTAQPCRTTPGGPEALRRGVAGISLREPLVTTGAGGWHHASYAILEMTEADLATSAK